MRPTRNVAIKNDRGDTEVVDKPEWRTRSKWLHWDLVIL